ncbi:hypothetical protein JCM6882_009248 [Rhodosporidiobolus microsporus]
MTSHQGYPSHHTSNTGAGYSNTNPGTHAYDAGATTGDKIQSRIPGTDEYQQRKAYEHASGPTSATGATPLGGSNTGYGNHHTAATAGTTGTTGGGLASKVPGTDAYKATHPTSGTHTTSAGYGSSTGPSYGSTGTHGTHTTHGTRGTTGTHGVGTGTHHTTSVGTGATGATGAGVASKNGNHHSTHASHVANSSGLQPGAPGTSTTTTTTTVPKPTVGDKISGKVDVAVGKLTHNPGKVAAGEIKQHEGKVGLQQAGLAGSTTGTGATGAHSTGRY